MSRRVLAFAALAVALSACVAPASAPTAPTTIASTAPASSGSPATPAASGTDKGATPALALTDLPRIDGSTANIPLISLAIQRLTGAGEAEADNTVKTTGTPTAWRHLVAGDTDLLVVYEADRGVQREVKESGVALEVHPIGRDALVFFTNSGNPVKSLTTAQYKAIYTGKVTNWSQVGGREVKIVGYQRPEESGSQALLRKYVVGDAKLVKAPAELMSGEMGAIIEGVASYANTGNALGYSVYYYLANMYAVEGISMMGVGTVMPTNATIADGSYPYTNDFSVAIRADEPAGSPARIVMEWLTGEAGRQAVLDAGYVATGK